MEVNYAWFDIPLVAPDSLVIEQLHFTVTLPLVASRLSCLSALQESAGTK